MVRSVNKRRKHWLKVAGLAAAVVVGYDLMKAHTGIARPQGNGVNQ